uniref:Ig-like domain-containing protein n=1 Tax=Seriola dumerili TaxID=41447 RepID=A0A3B4TQ83_SERDU
MDMARDSSFTHNCEFFLDSENLGHMDIEWNILHRVYFTSPEHQNGIASLTITDLKLTDSGTYQCKVKKLREIVIKNFILSVMERPSMPVCYMDGEAVAGEDLRLRCRSSQGTPPMDYRWSKTSGNQKLPHTVFADTIEGDLYLDKMTESDTVTYLCTVLSLVGIEERELILSKVSVRVKTPFLCMCLLNLKNVMIYLWNLCVSQKENPGAYGPIEHGATPHVEAKVSISKNVLVSCKRITVKFKPNFSRLPLN